MNVSQRRQLWDNQSSTYEALPSVTVKTWPMPKSFLPDPNTQLVDIGCGSGRFFPLFQSLTPHLYGMDVSPKMVEIASKHAECVVGDVSQLPYPDARFDYVFSYGVIGCSGDAQLGLAELSRICVPEKTVVIVVPHRRSVFAGVRAVAMALGTYTHVQIDHFSKSQIREMGKQCGMTLEETYVYSRHPVTRSSLRRAVGETAWFFDRVGQSVLPFSWGEMLCARFKKN